MALLTRHPDISQPDSYLNQNHIRAVGNSTALFFYPAVYTDKGLY